MAERGEWTLPARIPCAAIKPDHDRGPAPSGTRQKGTGRRQIPPLVLLTDDGSFSNKNAEYFQNLFRRTLGIEIKIDKQIFKQRLAKMTSGDFDMVSGGLGARTSMIH